jgi:hypothetical protein
VAKIKGAVVRDTTQWLIGAAIAINETFFKEEPQWISLVFAGVLMGIPALIGLVQLSRSDGSVQPPTTPSLPSSSPSSS